MTRKLFSRGFLSLVVTQFFGAANDNILKTVLVFQVVKGIWQGRLGEGGQGLVSLCMFLPFILLSGYAGQFADRNSKRLVCVLVKVVEVPIAMIALVGFWTDNLWLALLAMLMLACQSAFFGPAKYGMIPELVDDGQLSRANGVINMMTNIAVIAGTVLAGYVSVKYAPGVSGAGAGGAAGAAVANRVPWLPGFVLLAVAVVGLLAALCMPPLVPGDRTLRYSANPLHSYFKAVREMAEGPLLMVALAWGFFYFLAGLALLIMPEYATVLGIDDFKASTLLAILGIGIGVGSVLAGVVSGNRIEPRLISVGAIGISVFFLLLGSLAHSYLVVAILVCGAGLFAGFYIIPLQAMLQHLSPDDERGRFLGTANAISFSFLSLASLLYWVIRPLFGSEPQRIFYLSAVCMMIGATFFLMRLRKLLTKEALATRSD